MDGPKRVGGIEIDQDLGYQQLAWKIERVGWGVGVFILVAALLGLLGPGPLSRTTAGTRDSSLWMEFNRFERRQSPSELKIHIGPEGVQDGRAQLWLSRRFVESVEIHRIQPEPERVEVGTNRFIYSFNINKNEAPVQILFHFEPNTFGRMAADIGVDRQIVKFSQFYFP